MGAVSGLAAALSRTPPPGGEEIRPALTPAEILTGYVLPAGTHGRTVVHGLASGLAVDRRRGPRRVPVPPRGPAPAPARRQVAAGPEHHVARGPGRAGLLHLRRALRLRPGAVQRPHARPHGTDHDRPGLPRPRRPGHPGAQGPASPRRDGSRGPREWIMVLLHSRAAAVLTHPLFVAANFAGSIVLFYYSDAFGFALREHVGHELMTVHFVITGYLFVLSMVGTDPLPRRAPYPLRLLLLLATMAFHAFFGVTLMGSTTLIQPEWFTRLGRDWGLPALADQQMAGAITWGIGEIPTLLIAIGVAVMWSRADAREMRRTDRAADRNNDADLDAYNAMLSRLGQRGTRLRRIDPATVGNDSGGPAESASAPRPCPTGRPPGPGPVWYAATVRRDLDEVSGARLSHVPDDPPVTSLAPGTACTFAEPGCPAGQPAVTPPYPQGSDWRHFHERTRPRPRRHRNQPPRQTDRRFRHHLHGDDRGDHRLGPHRKPGAAGRRRPHVHRLRRPADRSHRRVAGAETGHTQAHLGLQARRDHRRGRAGCPAAGRRRLRHHRSHPPAHRAPRNRRLHDAVVRHHRPGRQRRRADRPRLGPEPQLQHEGRVPGSAQRRPRIGGRHRRGNHHRASPAGSRPTPSCPC